MCGACEVWRERKGSPAPPATHARGPPELGDHRPQVGGAGGPGGHQVLEPLPVAAEPAGQLMRKGVAAVERRFGALPAERGGRRGGEALIFRRHARRVRRRLGRGQPRRPGDGRAAVQLRHGGCPKFTAPMGGARGSRGAWAGRGDAAGGPHADRGSGASLVARGVQTKTGNGVVRATKNAAPFGAAGRKRPPTRACAACAESLTHARWPASNGAGTAQAAVGKAAGGIFSFLPWRHGGFWDRARSGVLCVTVADREILDLHF